MIPTEEIIAYLQAHLKPRRFIHTLGVRDTAVLLAQRFGENPEKAALAALVHDCAKWMDDDALLSYARKTDFPLSEETPRSVIHAPAGMVLAKEKFGIEDAQILSAVCWHSVPRVGMTPFEMIISLADVIEPSRRQPGVEELRALAETDLEKAFCASLAATAVYLLQSGQALAPGTVLEYNRLIRLKNKE